MSQYSLRLPDSLMQAAKDAAATDQCSLNQFFLSAIAEKVGTMKAMNVIDQRATMADDSAFNAVLNKVQKLDGKPVDGDT